MKRTLFAFLFTLVATVVASAQTPAWKMEWDYLGTLPADVQTYTNHNAYVDGVLQKAPITCALKAGSTTDTTCSVVLNTAPANGTHTLRVTATKNAITSDLGVSGLDPANGPKTGGSIRLTVSVNVTIGS